VILPQGELVPRRFALYGVDALTVSRVSLIVAAVLGVNFSLRNSSYKGGDYYLYRGMERLEISIEGNECDDEGVPVEPEFPLYAVLVYVNNSTDEVERKLSNLNELKLLRLEIV
jgi:hypothetical protein